MLGFGIVGLGVYGLAQWFARGRRLVEKAADTKPTGELR